MTRFTDELGQMPDALHALVGHYRGAKGAEALQRWRDMMSSHVGNVASDLAGNLARSRVAFVGMGTSRFAGLVAARALARAGVSCAGIDAGEWLHEGRPVHADEQVIAVSQSGRSAEVVALLEQGMLPRPLVAVTNDLESPLAREADLTLPLHAGNEATISTKSYANTLALAWLMGVAIEERDERPAALEALSTAADGLGRMDQAAMGAIQIVADHLGGIEQLAFVGRGPSWVAARQAALTFSEGIRMVATAFSGGAFRHGPLECCGPKLGLVLLAPAGPTQKLMLNLADEAASYGARVAVFIDGCGSAATAKHPMVTVANPELPAIMADKAEELFPLLVARVQNHLLHAVAAGRGIEAGQFRYGSKITDRE